MRQYQKGSTITAIATPPGEGAIATIRISGPEAIPVAERIFTGKAGSYASHTAHLGHILNAQGASIDQVILTVFKNPRSYTGEDSVEIQCHGGSFITRKVLERIIEAGAQPALPGEFTFQAFINGKLDLAQAEAVQQLIGSRNELARQNAADQLQGALSKQVAGFQKELTELTAILEAWVDFPEEGLEFLSMEEFLQRLDAVLGKMRRLQGTFHNGKAIHEGLSLCLLGAPNVGKSSLMNALLGVDRAIVTDIAGTTRDLLEEDLRLGGLHFRLVDTAGIRKTDEPIEQEGIRRSKAAMQRADLILLILDASRPLSAEDHSLLADAPPEKTLVVWNKIDLQEPCEDLPAIRLSAKESLGLDELAAAIERKIWKEGPPSKEEVLLASERHFKALSEAIDNASAAANGLRSGVSPEFIAFDLRSSLHQLSSILGTNVSEDILTSIFSQFCLGK